MKVIIVDDSEMIRKYLRNLLSEFPNITLVGEATNTADAELLIDTRKPDLVILDLYMPGENGIHLISRLKHKKQTPIIMVLTNYPIEGLRYKSLEDGAQYFFDKSRDIEKVNETIEMLSKKVYLN